MQSDGSDWWFVVTTAIEKTATILIFVFFLFSLEGRIAFLADKCVQLSHRNVAVPSVCVYTTPQVVHTHQVIHVSFRMFIASTPEK